MKNSPSKKLSFFNSLKLNVLDGMPVSATKD